MNEQKAQEDLAYIRELMQETRRATYLSGAYFIVWGFATGFGLLATWLALTGLLPLDSPGRSLFWSWVVAIALGGLGTWWAVRREKYMPAVRPGGELIGQVWLSMSVIMGGMFFVGSTTGNLHGALMPALSSLVVGSAVYLTGILAGITWIRNLAFGWWVGGLLMLASPGLWNLWFMGLMLLALYLVPGIILNRKLAGAA